MSIIKQGMRIDMHCHVLGNGKDLKKAINGEDIYYNIDDNKSDYSKFIVKNLVTRMIEANINNSGGNIKHGEISADEYFELILKVFINSKEIDGLVLLAMDAFYDRKTGDIQEKETDLFISNKYLFNKTKELNAKLKAKGINNKEFYFGASVSPNRKDWENELDYVCNETNAVLIKWIPSAMNIEVDNLANKPFYAKLVENEMPLLCHVGEEMAFIEGMNRKEKDNFYKLTLPLDCGVKVIAAHCASPMYPFHDESIEDFLNMMKKYNSDGTVRLWGDTSALTMTTRALFIEKYAKYFPKEWLIHGSDFPVPIEAYSLTPSFSNDITFSEFLNFVKIRNTFDLDVKIKRTHGYHDSILKNAINVLR